MSTFMQTVMDAERKYLSNALIQSKGNVQAAAKKACLTPTTYYRKIKELGVKIPNKHNRKTHRKLPAKSIHIQTLLPFFGVPCDAPKHGMGFWERYNGSLEAMFFDARKNYMAMVRKFHEAGSCPDGERLAHINALWQQLETAMRKHGVECP